MWLAEACYIFRVCVTDSSKFPGPIDVEIDPSNDIRNGLPVFIGDVHMNKRHFTAAGANGLPVNVEAQARRLRVCAAKTPQSVFRL